MRTFLMTSVAASVILLAACQRQEAPREISTAPPVTETPVAVEEPATPEAAVQSAQALDESAASAGPDVASYEFNDGDTPVRAAHDPRHGLRLVEGRRSYFYRPGETAPYLVRDGDYDYAYRGGQFTGATDRQGRRVDDRRLEARRRQADEALTHGRDLRRRAENNAPPAARDPRPTRDNRPDQPRHDTRPPPAATPAPPLPATATPDKTPDQPRRDRNRDRDTARSGADRDRDQVSDREDRRPRDPAQQ